MHTVKKLFQCRSGQFGSGPEMCLSVVVAVLDGKKVHKFKMAGTGLEYKFDTQLALQKFHQHKFMSKKQKLCIVIPLSFCQAVKKRGEVKKYEKDISKGPASMSEVQKQASFI